MTDIKDIIKSAFPNTELPSDKESDEFAEKEMTKSVIRDWTKHSPLNFYGLFEQDNLDKMSSFNPSPKSELDKVLIEQAEVMDKTIRDYLKAHNLTAQDWVNNGRIEKVPTAQGLYSLSWEVRFYYKDERIV